MIESRRVLEYQSAPSPFKETLRLSSHRSFLRVFLLAALFAAGCAYGMLAERHALFPHKQVRAVLTALGGGSSDEAGLPETGHWNLARPCGPDGWALPAGGLTE